MKGGNVIKVIGLIGGLSWQSSIEYYRIINETINQRLGGHHSSECIIYSVGFDEIIKLQHRGEWETLSQIMIKAAQKIENSGADFILICANTMHKVADNVQNHIKVPLIHIVDVTAEKIRFKSLRKVGLLGTKFTMEQDFYKKRLNKKHNIEVIVPNKQDREIIHDIIHSELDFGIIKQSSRDSVKKIINNLAAMGAEGVVLGCTEIPLLVKQKDSEIPIFDTTTIHAQYAVELALK